jgi:hypothetical protein
MPGVDREFDNREEVLADRLVRLPLLHLLLQVLLLQMQLSAQIGVQQSSLDQNQVQRQLEVQHRQRIEKCRQQGL